MKIQYISDLHLEFPGNRDYIKNNPIIPSADVLIIAGDTGYLNGRRTHHIYDKSCDKFFEYCSENWKYTFVIPGNHEWYGCRCMDTTPTKYNICDNVIFLNNRISDAIDIGDEYKLKVFGATLWSNIPAKDYGEVSRRMNDYNFIKYSQHTSFRVGLSIEEHFKTVNNIKWLSNKTTRLNPKIYNHIPSHEPYKLVIATHHGCHPDCINEKYISSSLNSAYYTDLRELIDIIQPEAWIFGHTHHTQSFKYNDTIIAENSLGYVDYGESSHFKHDQTIEI